MKISWFKMPNVWIDVKNAARTTISKDISEKEPPDWWKKRILLAEHSPIRKIKASWKWSDLFYWVSVHLVRHKYGIEHFVSTQRTDRTGTDRNKKLQDALIDHEVDVNAQALINISRKRLCNGASKETREAWKLAIKKIENIDPVVYSILVPECIYRGFCPDGQGETGFNGCGYDKTEAFQDRLKEYRSVVKESKLENVRLDEGVN